MSCILHTYEKKKKKNPTDCSKAKCTWNDCVANALAKCNLANITTVVRRWSCPMSLWDRSTVQWKVQYLTGPKWVPHCRLESRINVIVMPFVSSKYFVPTYHKGIGCHNIMCTHGVEISNIKHTAVYTWRPAVEYSHFSFW